MVGKVIQASQVAGKAVEDDGETVEEEGEGFGVLHELQLVVGWRLDIEI